MAKREEIVESFGSIYTSITEDVVNKCWYLHSFVEVTTGSNYLSYAGLEICNKYNIGGEYLADEWAAFTVSNLNGEEPTVEYLETMVRKESSKWMKHQSNKDHSSFQSSVKSYVLMMSKRTHFLLLFCLVLGMSITCKVEKAWNILLVDLHTRYAHLQFTRCLLKINAFFRDIIISFEFSTKLATIFSSPSLHMNNR